MSSGSGGDETSEEGSGISLQKGIGVTSGRAMICAQEGLKGLES